jgi:hypothetical protein
MLGIKKKNRRGIIERKKNWVFYPKISNVFWVSHNFTSYNKLRRETGIEKNQGSSECLARVRPWIKIPVPQKEKRKKNEAIRSTYDRILGDLAT